MGRGIPRHSGPLVRQPAARGAPRPQELHVQFGADAARQAVVSWASSRPASRPHLRVGTPQDGTGSTVEAVERNYADTLTGERVWAYHCPLGELQPDTVYVYEAVHRGAPPAGGSFRTGPDGRAGTFRFTSFGDHGIPEPVGLGLGPSSPNARHVVDSVEAAEPLFCLVNGDLSYANASDAPLSTWTSWFDNVTRSARYRPWMPCAGNHENEVGNGPQGYLAYQTRFFLPDNGETGDFLGNWYAFTVGAVRVVSVNGDDFCIQDGGFSEQRARNLPGSPRRDSYIHGYSGGRQLAWLERTLDTARHDPEIDWLVVVMHQVAMSSAPFNGADLGIRQALLPLFDRYGVDLVLGGHEHHYERTHPVRGVVQGSPVLTPEVGRFDGGAIDTTGGRVHVTIGVGGHPTFPAPAAFAEPAEGLVIVDVGPPSLSCQRPPRKEREAGDWLAARVVDRPYGYTLFEVDPGAPGGTTRIEATHFGALAGSPRYEPVDRFVLERPRNDALAERSGTGINRRPVGR